MDEKKTFEKKKVLSTIHIKTQTHVTGTLAHTYLHDLHKFCVMDLKPEQLMSK